VKKEEQKASLPLTELKQILKENSELLTKTAVEQDILDGGIREVIYVFSPEEALTPGWGEDGDPNDGNIRHLFNRKN